MSISAQAGTLLDALRARRPLVHCMTNYVTINDCANAALAIGASPIMADDPGEAAEITAHAAALVLNIGKLDPRTLEGMVLAGKEANRLGLPVVFDPVGAGVSTLGGQAVRRIVREVRLSAGAGFVVVICGNIMTMPGLPKKPAAVNIDVDAEGRISGLF